MSAIYFSTSIFMIILLTILLLRIWSYIDSCQSKNYALAFIFVVVLYTFLDALFVKYFLQDKSNGKDDKEREEIADKGDNPSCLREDDRG